MLLFALFIKNTPYISTERLLKTKSIVVVVDRTISPQSPLSSCFGALSRTTHSSSADGVVAEL